MPYTIIPIENPSQLPDVLLCEYGAMEPEEAAHRFTATYGVAPERLYAYGPNFWIEVPRNGGPHANLIT